MMQDNLIEGFRLSTQQQRLWLLGQDSEAFCSLCTIILEGDLQADTLRQAVQRVIHRHEILRTTFCRRAGMKVPLQMVADNMIPFWQHFDLTELNASEQTAKVEHICHQQTRLPFNFDQGPLLRLYLLTLSGQKHVLLLCLPALCADAVALSNLVHEISRAYDAVLSSQDMGEEPLQYVDFCAWQEEMLETEDEDAALGKEYWRKQNVSSAPALLFPCEDKRNTRTQFVPKSFSLVIGPDAIKRIDLIVRQYDTSVSEFFLACWQTVLWKLTGQSELLIACEFDGRTVEDLRTALGLFARSLPILCRIGKDCAFGEVLTRVTEATRAARKWQDYFEWETGVDAVDEPIRPNYFPVAFEFHEVLPTHDAPGLSFSIGKRHVCFEKFKLKLSCSYFDDSLTAEFQYDPNVFLADDVERLAGQFHTLLTRAVNDTEAPIGELEVLSHIEKQRLLVEWNDTKSDCSKEKCIHQLFEEQAVRAPANIAVVYDDQQLTYKQLNSRANQLAHYLRGIGVQPETQVALCVESVAMVPALLGVLKAGGAYVPLDPMLPKERLAFMLRDSQAAVLLTQQHLLENLPEYKGQVICLDAGWNLVAQQTQENPISGVTSKNLAYVLFTSGSTGNPKGVAVEHQQLLNYLHGILPRLDLPGGANFATFSTFAADLGNTAIFPSLCTGGCLHLISRERASDPNALADYFTRHLIDCVKIVPPHLEALLTSSRPERVLPRRRLVLGGEAASWDLIKRLQALATDCVILNHYGPTEATVGVTTYRVENGQSDSRSATVPIGRPIANTEIYLLDTHLRPVPIWVPGELYIGGANVSRGYLNHPELTAEKFIPDPFSAEPSARLYKTGDLARYQPDGNIEFLGRIDNQVKIRGFRIELGEIEAVLTQHPSVRQAVTVLREDVPGDKRLVACIVPNTERASTINDLRNFLKSKLPEYMVPAALVFIDELPLTPNGKVDRRALPGADHIRPDLEESFVAPRTPIEQALAEIWTEILKLEQFGVHDNFFDLGGHSLLATRVISRIRQEFQMDLPLRTLFENPTVADLAVQIAEVPQKRAVPEQLIEVLADLAVLSDEEAERQLEASKLQ